MTKLDLKAIETNLGKSGFLLEHEVTEILRRNGWNVINNKYYLDDVQDVAREIDLIAYKVSKIKLDFPKTSQNLFFYTTLVVSCKKNEEKCWALLFRDADKKNPNIEWQPIKNWTNN